jgi:hypothetical protein
MLNRCPRVADSRLAIGSVSPEDARLLTSYSSVPSRSQMQVLRIGHVRRAHCSKPMAGVDFAELPTIIELLNGY